MSRFFKLQVDLDELTDAMYQFVTEPTPRRNDLPIVEELDDVNPDIVDVLECMVLDGTEDRGDVAAYVHAIFGAHGPGPVKQES
jgi:hypothetical protein